MVYSLLWVMQDFVHQPYGDQTGNSYNMITESCDLYISGSLVLLDSRDQRDVLFSFRILSLEFRV